MPRMRSYRGRELVLGVIMNKRSKNSASFLDFFRSVSFESPRPSVDGVVKPDGHFYVLRGKFRNTVEQPADERTLIRSYN